VLTIKATDVYRKTPTPNITPTQYFKKQHRLPNSVIRHFFLQGVQLKSGLYFNMSNLFTKIYNMLYYTPNLYLQYVLEIISIHFNALIDTFHHVPRNFS
jgi:hypothetical protein